LEVGLKRNENCQIFPPDGTGGTCQLSAISSLSWLLYKTEPVPEKNSPHTVFIITNEIPRQTEIKLTERKGFSMVCLTV
jgi:hypothetical protein